MRVVLSQPHFRKALSLLNAVAKKTNVGPFRWVKLRADKHLELQGTNGKVYLTILIPAEIDEQGEICVEAAELLNAVKPIKMKNIELYIKSEKVDKLALKTDSLTQLIELKPVEMFPVFPEPRFEASLPAPMLYDGIEKVGFAVAKERGPLGHLYIDGRGDHVRFVGSDGYRLAMLKNEYAFDLKVKLYHESLKILRKLLQDSDSNSDVHIGYSESKLAYITNRSRLVFITNGAWTIAIRDFSVERYPNYDAVIPHIENYDTVVEISAEDLNNALKNFTKSDKITFEFFAKEFFKIQSRDKEIFVKAIVHGLDIPNDIFLSDIGFYLDFNPIQLTEFTKVAGKDSHTIEARFKNDDEVPAMFKVNDNYFYLVMPLKFEKSR